jgi:hypothetical protein
MIEHILPHLQTFIENKITLTGNSGRNVVSPLDFPAILPPEKLPCFVNQITGFTLLNQNSLYAVYNVTVTVRLYYRIVGQDVALKHQYDLYHYASAFVQAVIDQPRLLVNGGVMPNIDRAVTFSGTQVPANIPYPIDDPQGSRYTGAVFTLLIPIQVVRCKDG